MKSHEPEWTPGFRDVLRAMGALVLLVLLALLCGCANGVVMTDEETIACRDQGCNAFTESEFLRFMGKAFKDGYLQGWGDAGRQMGRKL